MKREEAITQVCDILYGYEEVPEAMYKNACSRVRDIINQIDEPKCNHCKDWGQLLEVQYLKQEHKWHKVS